MAGKLGVVPEFVEGDWRKGADPARIEARLADDKQHAIKAVCVVHNETSTGVVSRIAEVRKAIDRAKHPALFMVDTISSLASIDYRHDEWGVDVTVAGSQKGTDAAAGAFLQCRFRQGDRRGEDGEAAAFLLELGRDDRCQQGRLVSRTRPRPTCSMGCAWR
jgi:aspartate aminotransferase-like enzyme